MKGIVFTEFMEMVEKEFGLEMVDQLVNACPLHSKGIYTKVGTYDHQEMISLVGELSDTKKLPASSLINVFGRHLFASFVKSYPGFFKDQDTFSFLKSLDGYIHVEVKKLYSDAELPRFMCTEKDNTLTMHYQSSRPFADLAEGLIQETIQHFKEDIRLEVDKNSDPHKRDFKLTANG